MAGEAAQPDGVAHQQVVHGAEDGAEVGFAVGHQFRMGQRAAAAYICWFMPALYCASSWIEAGVMSGLAR
jgi:hypothetical protein